MLHFFHRKELEAILAMEMLSVSSTWDGSGTRPKQAPVPAPVGDQEDASDHGSASSMTIDVDQGDDDGDEVINEVDDPRLRWGRALAKQLETGVVPR
jgi:hypothetical protein